MKFISLPFVCNRRHQLSEDMVPVRAVVRLFLLRSGRATQENMVLLSRHCLISFGFLPS